MMRRFVVERPLPNIGDATREEQVSMAKVSAEIIERLGSGNMRWVESVFAADKVYCFYDARDLETVREHSAAFPTTRSPKSVSSWTRAAWAGPRMRRRPSPGRRADQALTAPSGRCPP
jgi:hypothetical protein